MKLEDEILVNKFGQGLVPIEQLSERFRLLEILKKRHPEGNGGGCSLSGQGVC